MQKQQVNKLLQNNAGFRVGEITAINSNGSYQVKVKGREYPYDKVNSIASVGTLQVGDMVTLAFYSRQMPDIIGFAGYYPAGTPIEVDV